MSKEWTYKYSLSLAAGPPGDTSGLKPESWDLGSRIKTQHIFWSVTYAWDSQRKKKIIIRMNLGGACSIPVQRQ